MCQEDLSRRQLREPSSGVFVALKDKLCQLKLKAGSNV